MLFYTTTDKAFQFLILQTKNILKTKLKKQKNTYIRFDEKKSANFCNKRLINRPKG